MAHIAFSDSQSKLEASEGWEKRQSGCIVDTYTGVSRRCEHHVWQIDRPGFSFPIIMISFVSNWVSMFKVGRMSMFFKCCTSRKITQYHGNSSISICTAAQHKTTELKIIIIGDLKRMSQNISYFCYQEYSRFRVCIQVV